MGGPNAINDILNNPRFQGAIDSISWLTEFIDSYFAMFISIVAFFIISAALLRNVVAGAYASYPKFWDGIAEVKEQVANQKLALGGRDASFLMRITAFFIPDLKKMSDFHDNNIEPKHYFMQAIPKMVAVVMIGVVIYNGYYRDAVAVTAGFGSELISRVLLNTDPVAVFDRIFDNMSKPEFATSGDKSTTGKYGEKVTGDIYSSIVTYWTDVKSEEARSMLAQNIESWVLEQMGQGGSYWDENNYKIKVQVDRVMGAPDLSRLAAGDTEIITTLSYSTPVSAFAFDSSQHVGEDWHIRFIARFEKIPEKATSSKTLTKLELTVGQFARGTSSYTIKLSNPEMFGKSGAKITVNGQEATWDPSTGTLTVPAIEAFANGDALSINAFTYSAEDDTGAKKVHSIRVLKYKAGSSATLSQGEMSFPVGQGPSFKSDKEKAEEGTKKKE